MSDLTPAEVAVLEEGGVELTPRESGRESPLVRTAADYAALLASSLTVSEVAELLGVDGSRVRQRLAAHSLYGIKLASGWRLPRFQFTESGLLNGFERIGPHLAGVHPVAVARWLSHPHADLVPNDERVSPRMWLEMGLDPDVLAPCCEIPISCAGGAPTSMTNLADELRGVA